MTGDKERKRKFKPVLIRRRAMAALRHNRAIGGRGCGESSVFRTAFTGTTGSDAHYRFVMKTIRPLVLLSAPLLAMGSAHAETLPAASAATGNGTVISLTPEQVEAAKEAAAERNMKTSDSVLNGGVVDRRIHGEAGFAIGTGGYSSIFGTAVMPLGQDGVLAMSFENSQADPVRYGYRRR